jgi:hypothetical protein
VDKDAAAKIAESIMLNNCDLFRELESTASRMAFYFFYSLQVLLLLIRVLNMEAWPKAIR